MNDTHDERGPFRDDLRTQLVTAGTEAAEQWLTVRANRKMSDVNRKRLAGHVVNVLWDEIERAAVEMAEHIAADQLSAATAELGRVNRRADFLDDALDGMRQQAIEVVKARNAATARAESATVLPERWRALIAERDAANERAEKAEALVAGFGPACCVCGRILGYRNYRDQLFCWPCADGEPKTTDAAPDGLSKPVERPETPGGHGEGSNSRATAAGLSEPEGGCPWCGTLQKLDADGLVSLHRLPNDLLCPGGTRRPNDDTTEDGQHG